MTVHIEIDLHASIVATGDEDPMVLTVPGRAETGAPLVALPFGPYDPQLHRTLDMGLRNWVEEQTQLNLGYLEQLYTFGDQGRQRGGVNSGRDNDLNFVSIGYLALVRRPADVHDKRSSNWHPWYRYFPWEDWRAGQPKLLSELLLPALCDWVRESPDERSEVTGLDRLARFRLAFGCDAQAKGAVLIDNWDEERVLERYELMYEAGLVDEAVSDGWVKKRAVAISPGQPMLHDHRRILATAIARLRAKLKYRPVVFELMPENFTLTELQQTVEMLSGQKLHKQNFRRMVEKAELVEPTGATRSQTGGRPAAYFRFRREITRERPAPGLRLGSRA